MIRVEVKYATNIRVDGVSRCKRNTVFSRAKPMSNNNEINSDSEKPNKRNTSAYKMFVKSNMPFAFFITVTFSMSMNTQQSCKYVSQILRACNKKYFPKKFLNNYMDGFAFIENHTLGTSKNDIHIHLLIKHNARYDKMNISQHEDIFREAATEIVDESNRRVFRNKCIDFQEGGDAGRVEYCFKSIWDRNLDRVKFIGKDGVSDSLGDGARH